MLRNRPAASVHLIGGRLCLDFVNSVGARRRKPSGAAIIRDEKLTGYVDLLAWGWHAGVLTAGEAAALERAARAQAAAAAHVHTRALRLREAIHEIASSAIVRGRPRAGPLAVLNAELTVARSGERLTWRGRNGAYHWHPKPPGLDRVVGAVALSAAEFFTQADLSRLRVCGGEDCGWLFEDTSRSRRRHWCDMRDCGNVAKVRRFRARQRRTSSRGRR